MIMHCWCHFLDPPTQSSAYVINEWSPTALCSATTRKIVATKALTWLNKEHTFTYIQGFQNTMHVFFNVTQCSSMTIFCSLNWFWKLNKKYCCVAPWFPMLNVIFTLHRCEFSFGIIYANDRKSTLTKDNTYKYDEVNIHF